MKVQADMFRVTRQSVRRTNSTVQFASRSLLKYNEKLNHVLVYVVKTACPSTLSSPVATHTVTKCLHAL